MGRKKINENYFSDVEEQGVNDYINATTKEEKNEIYEKVLKKPLDKMNSSILRSFPIFHGSHYENEILAFGLSHVIEQMIKFNPNRISKTGLQCRAYSYLGTILRNYYRHFSKEAYNKSLSHLNFDDYMNDVINNQNNICEIDTNFDSNKNETIYVELFSNIVDNIKCRLENTEMKPNDYSVGLGLIQIFENWEVLFLDESPDSNLDIQISSKYLKNKIYLILKEQTSLQLKDIRFALKNFRDIYEFEKKCLYADL